MEDYHYFQKSRRPEYKSRVERQIGEFLAERQIPFIYEKPTAVMDRGLLRIVYPDFSLQCGLLIEYFILFDPENRPDLNQLPVTNYKLPIGEKRRESTDEHR